MRKKLQIFVSSTYTDLKEERQACVETILKAGHIPAGMELFSAGDESQLDLIKRWIEDSDIFLLILGGRYGSIEPKSQLSYTEFEYKYALELKKPFFSLVISEDYLNKKAKAGRRKVTDFIEQTNYEKLQKFRELVLSTVSLFFANLDEIKLGVSLSINNIQSRYILNGWVKFDEIPDINEALDKIQQLSKQNAILEEEIKNIRTSRDMLIGQHFYESVVANLETTSVLVPSRITGIDGDSKYSVMQLFLKYQNEFKAGISNHPNATDLEVFLMQKVSPSLLKYSLLEPEVTKSDSWKHLKLSKEGEKLYYRNLLETL